MRLGDKLFDGEVVYYATGLFVGVLYILDCRIVRFPWDDLQEEARQTPAAARSDYGQ